MSHRDVHAVVLPVRDSHRRVGGSDWPAPRIDPSGAVVAVLGLGALLWLKIDASRELSIEPLASR
jgi:hypothetical protein